MVTKSTSPAALTKSMAPVRTVKSSEVLTISYSVGGRSRSMGSSTLSTTCATAAPPTTLGSVMVALAPGDSIVVKKRLRLTVRSTPTSEGKVALSSRSR